MCMYYACNMYTFTSSKLEIATLAFSKNCYDVGFMYNVSGACVTSAVVSIQPLFLYDKLKKKEF